jgi:hypothetical protein
LEEKTPKEAFIGVKVEVSHFCIFGFPIYIHVPIKKRRIPPAARVYLRVTVLLRRLAGSIFQSRGR